MSAASPATGAESKPERRSARRGQRKQAPETEIEVNLEHGRWRHFGWMLFGIVGGALLIWQLGVVGKWVGVGLLVVAVLNLRRFVMTLVHEAGRIEVGDQVSLPRGLCKASPLVLPIEEVRHAFFLRRAVPWTRAGPVLIIEAGEHILGYPRDWFASDSDQRRVAMVVNRRLGRL